MSKTSPSDKQLNAIADCYLARWDEFDLFRQQVAGFFQTSRHFQTKPLPLVHSVKSRLKDVDHLKDKVKRKWREDKITAENLFEKVTDLAGVRVLHLHTQQFAQIHKAINDHIKGGFWALFEPPVAYSWDPEATQFFKGLGLEAVTRDTYYTSIHYIVKPHLQTNLTCEIQIRTLFEEVWGEIDHALNYPNPTKNVACKEQLRVLAKLTSTGTRLADSIFKISK
jgi:ppGpp synthetase/RelA/SpoT-type nucleotidyltranferase